MTARMNGILKSGFKSIKIQTLYPWIIAAAGFLAYANSFSAPFLFDDAVVITSNPHIHYLWPPWKAVLSPARFLADYSFALNYFFSGNCPADFRLVNILIHLLAGLLLYVIIRDTLRLPRWRDEFGLTSDFLAFSIALLWTVHPLQTESVTYIAQRIEALMAVFFFLTLACFIRGVSSSNSKPWFVATFMACTLGMGTKEVMITAPPLVLLFDAVFVATSWKELFQKRWKIHAALFSTWIFLAILVKLAVIRAEAENVSLFASGDMRWNYALTQLNVLAHYFRLSVIPTSLCLDYYWPLVQSVHEAIWPGAITVFLGIGTLWTLWRRNWLGFLGAWVFIILAPTSSFNPLPDAAFEHRMYLPLAAVLTALVVGLHWILTTRVKSASRWGFKVFVVMSLIIGCGFGVLTHLRNQDYHSEETMWRAVMETRPGNYRPYISLSSAFINALRYEEAGIVCSNFLSRCPDFANMTFDEANQFIRPGLPPLPMYYAMIHNNLGLIDINLNSSEAAQQHYREALRIFPTFEAARRNLGHALFGENKLDEAIEEWRLNLNHHPRDYKTLEALGVAYNQKRDYEAASNAFGTALGIKPDFWFSRAQLAWLLATCQDDRIRNGPQAVEMATPLLEATRDQSPRALDILAAAYAEMGNYSNASLFCERALLLISSNTPPAEVAAIQKRCELYRSNRPYRDIATTPTLEK